MQEPNTAPQNDLEPAGMELCHLTDFFKVLGDPTRIRILFRLYDTEISVSQLASDLGMSDSAVSHQLQVLRISGLVEKRREGKAGFYRLADDHVRSIIAQGREHIAER